jgi:uncharacterized protein (TIGR04562 family)
MDNKRLKHRELLNRWSFNWDSLAVLIEGISPIDLAGLDIKNLYDADLLVRQYGYSPKDPINARYIHAAIIEALSFIETHLMPIEWQAGKRPPPEILYAHDIRELLLFASGHGEGDEERQAWACAVLKIIHAIAHVEQTRDVVLGAAREQIMSQFDKYVFSDGSGTLRFGSRQNNIELAAIDWKVSKSRQSILLKLLHKRGNVSEEINDLLGVRIITKKLCDVMRVAQLIREFHMITFVNSTPARARNTLIDMDTFRHNTQKLAQMLQDDKINQDEFVILMEHLAASTSKPRKTANAVNPHTGSNYRSVQFTVRQLIHLDNPYLAWMERLQEILSDEKLDPRIRQAMQMNEELYRAWMQNHGKSTRVFFPFEVHILDEASFEHNKSGLASHARYKKSQIRTVRRRILFHLLQILSKKHGARPDDSVA